MKLYWNMYLWWLTYSDYYQYMPEIYWIHWGSLKDSNLKWQIKTQYDKYTLKQICIPPIFDEFFSRCYRIAVFTQHLAIDTLATLFSHINCILEIVFGIRYLVLSLYWTQSVSWMVLCVRLLKTKNHEQIFIKCPYSFTLFDSNQHTRDITHIRYFSLIIWIFDFVSNLCAIWINGAVVVI